MKRPAPVVVLSVFYILLGGVWLSVFASTLVLALKETKESGSALSGMAMGFFFLVLSGFIIAVGYGLWQLRPWGRNGALLLAGATLLVLIVSLAAVGVGVRVADDDADEWHLRFGHLLQVFFLGPYSILFLAPVESLRLPISRNFHFAVAPIGNLLILWYLLRSSVRNVFRAHL